MKRLLYTLLISLLLAPAHLFAATPSKEAADKAYAEGRYQQAATLYEQILQSGKESHQVYYNLGCTYFRLDNMGRAILNFERADRLKRGDQATAENLALAYSRTQDQIKPLPRLFLAQWWENITRWLTTSEWYGLLLIVVLLLAAAVVWFLLSCDLRQRRLTLLASAVMLLLAVLTTACAVHSSSAYNQRYEAIVLSGYTSVKSSPESNGVERFVLHEGTKVRIEDEVNGWYLLRIDDGNSGWANASDVERI